MKITLLNLKFILSKTLKNKNNLNSQEKDNWINLFKRIKYSKLSNDTVLNNKELTEILGNNFTLIKDLKSEEYLIKSCKSKSLTIYEQKDVNIFNSKISHPCILIAINKNENETNGFFVHLTTKNWYKNKFFEGLKIGDKISIERLKKMKEEDPFGFIHLLNIHGIIIVNLELLDIDTLINRNIRRPIDSWQLGEYGDSNLEFYNDGIIQQYHPNVLLKCKLNNWEFSQSFFIKDKNIISEKTRNEIIHNIKKNKYIEIMEFECSKKNINNINFDNRFKKNYIFKEKEKLDNLIFLNFEKYFHLVDSEEENDVKEYICSLVNENSEELLNREIIIKHESSLNNDSSREIQDSLYKLINKINE